MDAEFLKFIIFKQIFTGYDQKDVFCVHALKSNAQLIQWMSTSHTPNQNPDT